MAVPNSLYLKKQHPSCTTTNRLTATFFPNMNKVTYNQLTTAHQI